MQFGDNIAMIDYYCQNKTTKDTVIVFYHAVKKITEQNSSHMVTQVHQKFTAYFSNKDISQLDREHKQVLKATTHIIQNYKQRFPLASENIDRQLSSEFLTPDNSINLGINSTRNQFIRKQSDTFKTSWNQQSSLSNIQPIRFENHYESVVSRFGANQSRSSESNLSNELEVYYTRLMQEYNNHQLDKANKTANDLENLLQNSGVQIENYQRWMNSIKDVQKQYIQMMSYYKQFDQPGWEFDNTTNNISLYSKIINKGQHVAVLITAELDVPLLNFLVMIQEIDLFSKFVPFCGKGQMLKRPSRNLYVARTTVDIPLLTNRETYFYSKMIDRISATNSLFYYSKSINSNPEACAKYGIKIPEKSDHIRLQYNFFVGEVKILSKDKIFVRMASSVDMKLNFLPNFVLMISARKFAYQYCMNILKEQSKFSQSEWAKRIRDNVSVYGYYKSLVDEYLGSH